MNQVVIRRPMAEDFDEWFDLFQEVADEDRWIGREGPLDRDDRRQAFERTLEADDAQSFIAERDGTVVGALGVTLNAGLAELGMMVRQAERGRGVGTALMAACIDWCRDRQAHKVTLTVWPHNERAITLYRNFGFVVEGRLARHHRRRSGELWDVLVMGLVLDTTSPGSTFADVRSAWRGPSEHPGPFTIRPVAPDDVDGVLGLVHELARYERAPDAVEMTAEQLHDALFAAGAKLFGHVATDTSGPGDVIGMALWFCNFSTWRGRHGVYVEDLFVHPEHRRRGIGEALLATLAKVCVDRGYTRLEWSVLDWNRPAIDFYRSLGAVGLDEWTVFRLDDEALAALANRTAEPR